jgi:hypothetical protein
MWTRRRNARAWLPWITAVVVAGVAIIGPQVYISKQNSHSYNPYPSTTVFSQLVPIGITLLKFATVEDEGHWRGLTYWSPYVAEPEEEKTADFYLRYPARGAFVLLTHAYAGFHYDQLLPYWQLARARPFTIWLALSSAIVFLGVVRMGVIVATGQLNADRAFAIGTLVLCVGSLVFVATESRFGLIGFAMLSITLAEWLGSRPARTNGAGSFRRWSCTSCSLSSATRGSSSSRTFIAPGRSWLDRPRRRAFRCTGCTTRPRPTRPTR